MDIGCHRIDLLNYLFGEARVVGAALGNQVHMFAVEDSATVTLEYPGPVRAVVDVRWNSRVERDEFRIVGTKGEMDLTPLNGSHLQWGANKESIPPHPNLHYPMIENFVSAVVEGAPLISSAETALFTDRTLAAAYGR